MATSSSIQDGDLRVRGTLVPDAMRYPAASIVNADISAAAAIETTKLRHRHVRSWAQPNTAATAETRTLHVVMLPGLINAVKVGSIAAAIGDSTVTVDVKKNNVSVLSSTVTLNSSNTARIAVSGTVNSAVDDVVAGDWIEVVITIAAGTGTLPTGVFVQVEIDENGI